MIITVDFLEFAVKNCELQKMLNFLSFEMLEFKHSGTFNVNYKKSLILSGFMKIGYDNDATNYDVYVSLSGSGCRLLEDLKGDSFDWYNFIFMLRNFFDVSFRRIDIAIDDYTRTLRTDRMWFKYYKRGRFAGSCRSVPKYIEGREEELLFGSSQSKYMIRIYNKALERGYKPGDDIVIPGTGEVVKFWWRLEQQIRADHADQFIDQWISAGSESLSAISCGHILEFIRFLTKVNDKSNSQRIPVVSWWLDFLDNVQRVKFVSKLGTAYNRHKLETFLNKQVASSIRTFLHLSGLSPEQLYHHFNNDEIHLNASQLALLRANAYNIKASLDLAALRSDINSAPVDPGFDLNAFRRDFINKLLQEDNQYVQLEMSDVNE